MRIQLLVRQYEATEPYFQAVDQYLALYPDDLDVIARVATNTWHKRNDMVAAERWIRRALVPAATGLGRRQNGLGIFLLGQERYADALTAFQKSRELGFTGGGTYYAYLFDAEGQHAEADRVYAAGNNGQDGIGNEFAVVTAIDRGQWPKAQSAAGDMLASATEAKDAMEILRAHAAIASVAVLAGDADAANQVRGLLAAIAVNGAAADQLYAPASSDIGLLAGLLAARIDDPNLMRQALQQVRNRDATKDYPTVGELLQVVLAEQERMQGKSQAAVARLLPLAKKPTALVVVHWALMRAQRAAGDEAGSVVQSRWLATHRGRVFTESVSTEVLTFFNAAVSAEALKATGNNAAIALPADAAGNAKRPGVTR